VRQLSARAAEPREHPRAELSGRSADAARAGPASGRGLRARAHARLPPARRRATVAPGAAGRRLVHHRHRDAVADRPLPVLPDPGGHRTAHPGRPPMKETILTPPPHTPPTVFTRAQLDWLPWLEPLAVDAMTERHLASLVDAARVKSPYFRLLARDPDALE